MTHRHGMIGIALAVCLTGACGGSSSSESASGTGEHHAGGEGEHHGHGAGHHEHGELPAELRAMHDVLAPIWHSTPGTERATAACAGAEALVERAGAVNGMITPDEVTGEPWSQGTARMLSDAEALRAECAASGPEVETRLSSLHDAFHALVEQVRAREAAGDGGEHHESLVEQQP